MKTNERLRPVDATPPHSRLVTATLACALSLMSIFILMTGQSVLIPFAISLLLWFIINALSSALRNGLRTATYIMPNWLSLTVALLIVLAACFGLAEIVAIALVRRAHVNPDANLEPR